MLNLVLDEHDLRNLDLVSKFVAKHNPTYKSAKDARKQMLAFAEEFAAKGVNTYVATGGHVVCIYRDGEGRLRAKFAIDPAVLFHGGDLDPAKL